MLQHYLLVAILSLFWSFGFITNTISSPVTFQYNPITNDSSLVAFQDTTFDPSGIDLTPSPDPNYGVGWLLYNKPIDLLQLASFSTTFSFQIFSNDTVSHALGDGLAFIIVSDTRGPAINTGGGGFGLYNGVGHVNNTFAVEFDTFKNDVFQDISESHVGIDITSVVSSAAVNTNGTSLDLRINDGSTFYTWIDYTSSTQLIQVYLTISQDQKPKFPLLNYTYDLSTIFNGKIYVALGASVGLAYEHHFIYSWNFSSTLQDSSVVPTIDTNYGCTDNCNLANHGCPGCIAGIAVGIFIFVAVLVVILAKYVSNKNVRKLDMIKIGAGPRRYTYRELRRATRGFSERNLVGSGAFGVVYKGVVPSEKSPIAVKKLRLCTKEHEDDFRSEVEIISSIRHRNLVELRGWCHERRKQLLVYDFIPNKSLEHHLFNTPNEASFGWKQRYKVALGVTAALEYLHEGSQQCIVHRDVKAANVLIDADYTALLGDFGLARFIEHDKVATMTAAGTTGYVAPELPLTGKATAKADVYSFGILALEIVSGRRVLDYTLPPQEAQLLHWVWLLHESNCLMDVIDRRLVNQGMQDNFKEVNQARCLLHVGLMCCHPIAEARPSMRQVLQVLREEKILPLGKSRPVISYSYDIPMTMDELFCNSNNSYYMSSPGYYGNGASSTSSITISTTSSSSSTAPLV